MRIIIKCKEAFMKESWIVSEEEIVNKGTKPPFGEIIDRLNYS